MDELIYQGSYTEFRDELKAELTKTAESFVKIGYMLKVARDTDILRMSGYRDLEDFARGEFDLDKTQVSRFIRINDRFSIGGNSEKLMTGYADFGVRKLGLMLTLPDEINEDLSPDYTVAEIESIKETYDEEQKVTPIDDYMEQTEAKAENNKAAEIAKKDILTAVLYQLGLDDPVIFRQMYESEDLTGSTDLFSVLAPGGESTHKVRIKGVGALLMVCTDKDVTITNMRTLEKKTYPWNIVNNRFLLQFEPQYSPEAYDQAYKKVYGEPYPEKTEVAPVQQEAKPEKKPSKVVDHIKKESPKETKKEQPKEPQNVRTTQSEPSQSYVTDMSKANSVEELKEMMNKSNPHENAEDKAEIAEKSTESESGAAADNAVDKSEVAAVVQEVAAGMEQGSRKGTWNTMLRSHNEARIITNNLRDTFTYDPEELGAEDIKEAMERVKKLQMHLEILMAGYEEIEKSK